MFSMISSSECSEGRAEHSTRGGLPKVADEENALAHRALHRGAVFTARGYTFPVRRRIEYDAPLILSLRDG